MGFFAYKPLVKGAEIAGSGADRAEAVRGGRYHIWQGYSCARLSLGKVYSLQQVAAQGWHKKKQLMENEFCIHLTDKMKDELDERCIQKYPWTGKVVFPVQGYC